MKITSTYLCIIFIFSLNYIRFAIILVQRKVWQRVLRLKINTRGVFERILETIKLKSDALKVLKAVKSDISMKTIRIIFNRSRLL